MKIGYIRCSTVEQNEARQMKMMEEQGIEKLFIDKASGKNTDRKEFREMMEFVRAGDMVVVESISRIARNTRDLLSIISDLTQKEVEFVSLKENIDTTTPQGRFMLTVFGALAELERENILERQREGIEIAKLQGKYRGRKPLEVDEKKFRSVCSKWRQGNDCHCRYEGNGIKAEYVLSTGKRNGAVRPHSNLHKKVQVSKGTTFIEKGTG